MSIMTICLFVLMALCGFTCYNTLRMWNSNLKDDAKTEGIISVILLIVVALILISCFNV